MTGKRTRVARLFVAALFTVPAIVGSTTTISLAGPTTEQEVRSAKARMDALSRRLEAVVEEYDQARVRLDQAQAHLAEAKRVRDAADAKAKRARDQLAQRAIDAYTGAGSQLNVLLDAESFTEFSDRMQFMGAIAQSDTDLATAAEAAGQRADWAAGRYADAVTERQAQLDDMAARRDQIKQMLDKQQAIYQQVFKERQDYVDYLAAQRAAAQAAAEAEREAAQSNGSGTGGASSGAGGFVPPPNATGAQIAIAAAKSVLGTGYVWGAADPNVGFDCSGLTSWAWAQAGVYLPHSSSDQYAVLPHVPLDQLQPGDLVFFYTPISHVALYIGGGLIIHARHPGPGGQVQMQSLASYDRPVGAARPG